MRELARRIGLEPGIGLAIGLVLFLLVVPGSFLGAALYPRSPYTLDVAHALSAPTLRFPFGTDELGRDILARMLSGGEVTLLVAIPAALLAFLVGTAYGLASGLAPAWLDNALMRLLDAMLALPSLIVLIFFASLVTLNEITLIALLGFVAWPSLARLVRNETFAARDRDFVHAARQMGAGPLHLARIHLLRTMTPVLVVNATLLLGDMVFVLSALSFLGLGVQPPKTSWGGLLENGLALIALRPWWLILPPGLAIFAVLFATSLIGEALVARGRGR